MTTCLYDNKTRALYADSLTTCGGMAVDRDARKLHIREVKGLGTCIIACAGDTEFIALGLHWLTGEREGKPEIKDDMFQCLILTADNDCYTCNDRTLEPFIDFSGVQTTGSGWQIAFVAMSLTGDPIEAMKVAKDMDINSGGDTWKGYFVDGEPVVERIID